MVSSQTEHVRGCHRGRNSSDRTIARGIGDRLRRSGRMALQSLFNNVSSCTFQAVLFLCELSDHHSDGTFENVLLPSLPTPTRAALLIIRGLSGQTVSFPQSQDLRTKVRPSGKQLLGYVPALRTCLTAQSCCSCPAIRRGSASQPPPRACSTYVPRKANRTLLTSHCMSLVAAADSETTHTAEVQRYNSPWGMEMARGVLDT